MLGILRCSRFVAERVNISSRATLPFARMVLMPASPEALPRDKDAPSNEGLQGSGEGLDDVVGGDDGVGGPNMSPELDGLNEEGDAVDDDEWTLLDEVGYHINRHQWVPIIIFVMGFSLFFVDAAWAWRTIGGALVLAGLYPIITGVYRSPFGLLLGWKARVRGLVSVAIGVVIAFLG